MIKQKDVLLLLLNQGRDMPAAKTLSITHHDGPSLYVPSQKDIILKIQAADAFVENYQVLVPFHANAFYRYATVLLDELHVRLLE